MAIDAVTNSGASPFQSYATDGADRTPKKSLGQNEFFKLISVQFASQDPLSPMEDTAFIAQLANFSALESSTQLATAFNRFADQQGFTSAQNLLGRNVTLWDNTTSMEVTGEVSAVHHDGEKTLITVNGIDYESDSVRRVELNDNSDLES